MEPADGYSVVDESLPAYSLTYSYDGETIHDRKSKGTFASRVGRSFTQSSVVQRVRPVLSISTHDASYFWQQKAWPAVRGSQFTKRQTYGFLLFLLLGFVPFLLCGIIMTLIGQNEFYVDAFTEKFMLGVTGILQLLWSTMMYIVWQDAQFNSKLVQSGLKMSSLKAAFVLTESAKRHMEWEDGELIRKDKKELERQLLGTRKRRGAQIERNVFREGRYELKRTVIEEDREM